MPTYDYRCEACGHSFELFQRIGSRPRRTCPECGKRRARRQIGSGSGIIFKGSGFHQTDYRSEEYKKRAKEEKESASPGGAAEKPGESSKKAPEGGKSGEGNRGE